FGGLRVRFRFHITQLFDQSIRLRKHRTDKGATDQSVLDLSIEFDVPLPDCYRPCPSSTPPPYQRPPLLSRVTDRLTLRLSAACGETTNQFSGQTVSTAAICSNLVEISYCPTIRLCGDACSEPIERLDDTRRVACSDNAHA